MMGDSLIYHYFYYLSLPGSCESEIVRPATPPKIHQRMLVNEAIHIPQINCTSPYLRTLRLETVK